MKKTIPFIVLFILLTCIRGNCHAEITESPAMPFIGIAWQSDTDSEFFTNICRAMEEAGGTWVLLDQVLSTDLSYDSHGHLLNSATDNGSLSASDASLVRVNTWHNSNAEDAVQNISAVLFSGGEDISPTLFDAAEEWPRRIGEESDYNPERDVSDYLTMSYCLDHDIPVMGICRGMQMLSVVSGADIIQDISDYFDALSLDYDFNHRNETSSPDVYRDYAPHDIQIVKGSFLYDMVGTELLSGCPSWHHQAVRNVDGTHLAVTGFNLTKGIQIIEAVERTDKTFAVGLQFHPEAAVEKHLDNAENQDDYMDYDTALSIFKWVVQERFFSMEEAA